MEMKVIHSASFAFLLAVLLSGCSHDYESNTLDLGFYQWNLWVDPGGSADYDSRTPLEGELHGNVVNPPSCGWEELHRGNGKLVRVPTPVSTHFPAEEYSGVTWYHCRYTLPELWDKKQVVLTCESAGYKTEVYLNERLAGVHIGSDTPFEVDLTEQIYYTRDNHLSIRITDPEFGNAGILGTLVLKISDAESDQAESGH